MSKSYTSATAAFVLAAALVLVTWLPTVSTPSAASVTAQAADASHVAVM